MPDRTLYRLYHQTLSDFLRAPGPQSGNERNQAADERLIADTLIRGVRRLRGTTRDWARTSMYVRCHLLEHAIASGDAALIDTLVTDPWFLANGGQAELRSALDSLAEVQHQAIADSYRSALASIRNASNVGPGSTAIALRPELRRMFLGQLTLAARCRGTDVLAERVMLGKASHEAPWRADWAAWRQQPPHVQLTGFKDHVWAAATATLSDGRTVVITAGESGELRVWDILTGTLMRRVPRAHAGRVLRLAAGRLHDGRPFVVSSGDDAEAHTWDLDSGDRVGPSFTQHKSPIHGVALTDFRGQTAVVTGDDDGVVEIWSVRTGQRLREAYQPIDSQVTAVEVLALDGALQVVSAHLSGDLCLWKPTIPAARLEQHRLSGRATRALAVGTVEGRQVLVSAGEDNEIRLWDPVGQPRLPDAPKTLATHPGRLLALAVADVSGHSAVIAAGDNKVVRIWDIADGTPIGAPFTGHTDRVRAIAVAETGHRTIVVSAGDDAVPMVWDLTPTGMANEPFTGHRHRIRSLLFTNLGGRPRLISGSSDATVRRWDPDTGVQTGRAFEQHRRWVRALAVANIAGRECIITGGADTMMRIWDAASGEEIRDPLRHPAGVTAAVVLRGESSSLLVSACLDGSALIHDLATWRQVASYSGHQKANAGERAIWALCPLQVEAAGADSVVVSAGDDGNLHVWKAASGQVVMVPPSGHRVVSALTAIPEWGKAYVATGGDDGSIQVHCLEPQDRSQSWMVGSGASASEPHGPRAEALVAANANADSAVLVTAHSNGEVRFTGVANTASGVSATKPVSYPRAHRGHARALTVGNAGGRPAIFSGGDDYLIRAWDVERQAPLRTLHQGWVRSLIVAPSTAGWLGTGGSAEEHGLSSQQRAASDDWIVISGGDDDTIRMRPLRWDRTRQHEHVILAHHRGVRALAISRTDPPYLISGGVDGRLKVWNPSSGHPPHLFSGHSGWVRALATGTSRSDSAVAVSASGDGSVGVWDLSNLTAITIPRAVHTGRVRAIGIARLASAETREKRSVIVSGGADGEIAITDLNGSAAAPPFNGFRSSVRALAVTSLAEMPVVISGDEKGNVLAWGLESYSLVGEVPGGGEEISAIIAQQRGSRDAPGCTWVAVASGDRVTLSSWTQADSWRERAVARFGCPVLALAIPAESVEDEPAGHIVVAATQGVAVLDFSSPE